LLFGFNARLGRLHYFLGTIALAIATTAVLIAVLIYASPPIPRGAEPTLTWPIIIVIAVFAWLTFTLQCMRVRDIGWDPVCVIPAWIAILIVDQLVASKIPAWSLDQEHHGTIVGSLVNLALILALTFWPSGDYQGPYETLRTPDQPSPRPKANSVAAARIARASGAGTGFGRRAF
jgi:uncharacterized membrane protein YhaH (DUF805 family)